MLVCFSPPQPAALLVFLVREFIVGCKYLTEETVTSFPPDLTQTCTSPTLNYSNWSSVYATTARHHSYLEWHQTLCLGHSLFSRESPIFVLLLSLIFALSIFNLAVCFLGILPLDIVYSCPTVWCFLLCSQLWDILTLCKVTLILLIWIPVFLCGFCCSPSVSRNFFLSFP